jgi:hypothetical protein
MSFDILQLVRVPICGDVRIIHQLPTERAGKLARRLCFCLLQGGSSEPISSVKQLPHLLRDREVVRGLCRALQQASAPQADAR